MGNPTDHLAVQRRASAFSLGLSVSSVTIAYKQQARVSRRKPLPSHWPLLSLTEEGLDLVYRQSNSRGKVKFIPSRDD